MNTSSQSTLKLSPYLALHARAARRPGQASGAVAAFVASMVVMLGTPACDEHFSTQEAYDTCEKLAESGPPADTPAGFSDCVACYEDCGNACIPSPEGYVCPDEEGEGGAGATGGAAP